MTVQPFTREQYEALGVRAPWTPPFALENRAARDEGGTGHYYASRGTTILGICVHITAGITDLDAPDTSAEATTNYGRTTTTAASWTGIADSDTIINSLHPDRVGFVQGVSGYNFNRPLMGLEIGKKDPDWRIEPAWWIDATLRNAAAYCAPYVVTYNIPLRVLTDRDEIQRLIEAGQRVGFTEHWNLTPSTRSDAGRVGAGTTFPWDRFFTLLREAIARIEGAEMARRAPTRADVRALEVELRNRGFEIYCGPSYVDRGYCAPGKHPHSATSAHFESMAVDFGWPGAPINDLEALHVELLMEELARHPEIAWRRVWNHAPGDHDDHGHVDNRLGWSGWNDSVKPRPGVRARDGIDLFVSPAAFPYHVPPGNHGYRLSHMVTAQTLLGRMTDPATGLALLRARVDGYWGPLTEAATKAAQRILGFPTREQDGIPGPATVRAIQDHLAKPPVVEPPKVEPPVVLPPPAPPAPVDPPGRLAGGDRYETAAQVALAAPAERRAKAYLVAGNSTTLADGLAAAAAGDGVVLYVRAGQDTLPSATAAAIRQLRPSTVVPVGSDHLVTTPAVLAARAAAGIQ